MISLTNLNAMRSAAAMAESNADIKTSMERLSTGSRINSASDDAAGLAISERMRTQIMGMAKGLQNAADAVSMLSTADGALSEVENMMQRMRELAILSSNGTSATADKVVLNQEFIRLAQEISRVGNNTQWNGTNLLDGSIGQAGQVGFVIGSDGSAVNQTFNTLAATTLSPTTDHDISRSGKAGYAVARTVNPVAEGADSATFNWYFASPILHSSWQHFENGDPITFSIDGVEYSGNVRGGSYSQGLLATDISWPKTSDGSQIHESNVNQVYFKLQADGEFEVDYVKFDTGSGEITVTASDFWLDNGSKVDGVAAEWTVSFGGTSFSVGDTIDINISPTMSPVPGGPNTFTYTVSSVDGDGNITGVTEPSPRPSHWFGGDFVANVSNGAIVISNNKQPQTWDDDTPLSVTHQDWGGDFEVSLPAASEPDQWKLSLGNAVYKEGDTIAFTIDGVAKVFEVSAVNNSGEVTSLRPHGSSLSISSQLTSIATTETGGAIFLSVDPANQISLRGANNDDPFTAALMASKNDGAVLGNDTSSRGLVAGLSYVDVLTREGSQSALFTIDHTLTKLASERASHGAATNALVMATDNLVNQKLSAEKSRSGVSDTNYAGESSNLASAQIRNQGAKAMLAQANTDQELTFKLIEDWL